jgi:hypothetical protein
MSVIRLLWGKNFSKITAFSFVWITVEHGTNFPRKLLDYKFFADFMVDKIKPDIYINGVSLLIKTRLLDYFSER